MADLEQVVEQKGIRVAIVAVPPETAQAAADSLVRAGVRSIVDFTAVPLPVPENVFVRHMDITSALETAAFFARQDGDWARIRPTPTPTTAADNGAETEMEPIITHHRFALGGSRHEAGRTRPPDRREGSDAGSRGRADHEDLRRRPGQRPAERGLQQDPAGHQPGQPADAAGGGTDGGAGQSASSMEWNPTRR